MIAFLLNDSLLFCFLSLFIAWKQKFRKSCLKYCFLFTISCFYFYFLFFNASICFASSYSIVLHQNLFLASFSSLYRLIVFHFDLHFFPNERSSKKKRKKNENPAYSVFTLHFFVHIFALLFTYWIPDFKIYLFPGQLVYILEDVSLFFIFIYLLLFTHSVTHMVAVLYYCFAFSYFFPLLPTLRRVSSLSQYNSFFYLVSCTLYSLLVCILSLQSVFLLRNSASLCIICYN